MIKCMLIDDEPLALELLQSHISKTEGVDLLASFTNPIEALREIENLQPGVVFSDIQMPELSGVQFTKIIGNKFPVIFTTAYDQYALEGYDLNVVDYLLKPITLKRFQQAVDKISKPAGLTTTDMLKSAQDYIFVKSEYKTLKIDLKDIHYIKGMADYVTIVLNDKKIHTLENLKFYEKILSGNRFMRIHKSYIIAMNKIEYIERNRVVLLGDHIPVSDSYKKVFFDRINNKFRQ